MPKKKIPKKELQFLGDQIKTNRDHCRLTQQQLAEQTGRGLRHIQNIEGGLSNPFYEVLSSVVHRLAMSTDILFYQDMAQVEEETKHLLCKFAACTEDERRFLLETLDCMVEQFIRRRYEEASGAKPE